MADTSLATVPEQQLAHRFGNLCARSVEVVSVADRTFEIPRDPDGNLIRPVDENGKTTMSDAEWNLHCDAMKSTRNMPGYLVAHYNRVETAQKLAGLKGAELPKIAQYVVNVTMQQRPEYPVIDVTPVDEGK